MKTRFAAIALIVLAVQACDAPDAVAPNGLTPNASASVAPRTYAREVIFDEIGPRYTHAGPGPHPTTESDRYSLINGGIQWVAGGTVEYEITGTEPITGANAQVVAGEAAWDALIAARDFARNDATTQENPCTGAPNAVHWTTIDGAGATAGATSFCYDLRSKEIVGFEIFLDSEEPWATNGSTTALDVGDVATHEFGHAVGLGHVGAPRDGCLSMYKFVSLGEIQKRTPGLGDKLGMAALYGNTNTTAGACGT
jgi:hypothetical protein